MPDYEQNQSVTRGQGLLEPWLARMRARKANGLLPDRLRDGRILDIGCGSYPYFLSHTAFNEKFAIDQQHNHAPPPDISWLQLDLNEEPSLPYEDGFFEAVTMLAVIEHLDPSSLVELFEDAYRVLAPGGRLIITTPAAWSDRLLQVMARLGMVSEEEIHEHAYAYTLPLLGWYLGRTGFAMDKIKLGYFECGLNMWAIADR